MGPPLIIGFVKPNHFHLLAVAPDLLHILKYFMIA